MFAAEAAGGVDPGFLLEHAYVVPLVMAASFALTLAIGKRLGKNASWIGIAAIGFSFLFAVGANVQWYDYVHDSEHAAEASHEEDEGTGEEADSHAEDTDTHAEDTEAEEEHSLATVAEGEVAAGPLAPAAEEGGGEGGEEAHLEFEVEPITKSWTWWTNGTVEFEVGMLLDGMAVMMLFVVSLISLLVHIFSTDYVAGDRRYTHYFAFLSLFSAAMLGFVMALSLNGAITRFHFSATSEEERRANNGTILLLMIGFALLTFGLVARSVYTTRNRDTR